MYDQAYRVDLDFGIQAAFPGMNVCIIPSTLIIERFQLSLSKQGLRYIRDNRVSQLSLKRAYVPQYIVPALKDHFQIEADDLII